MAGVLGAHVAAGIHGMIRSALSQHSFIGVVSAVDTGAQTVTLTRPGQTAVDPNGYKSLIAVSGLSAGNKVSVVEHGGSWVVMGKIQ